MLIVEHSNGKPCCRGGLVSSLKPLIVYCVDRYLPQDTSISVLSEKFGVVREMGSFFVMNRWRCNRQAAGVYAGEVKVVWWSAVIGRWLPCLLMKQNLEEFGEIFAPLAGVWTWEFYRISTPSRCVLQND